MICLSVCLLIAYSHIVSLFNGLIRQFVILPFKMDTIFIYSVFLLILLFSLQAIIIRSSPILFTIFALLAVAYLLTIIIFSYYSIEFYLKIGIDSLVFSVPCIFITYAIRDYKLLKEYLMIFAYIMLVSIIMNIFVFKRDIFNGHSYDQSYGYALLSVAIILGSSLFKRIKTGNFVFFALSAMLMLSMGARGPLFSFLLFVLLKVILLFKEKPRSIMLISCLGLPVILAICFLRRDILFIINDSFEKFNLSTRLFGKLSQGAFLKDNSRSLLLKISIDLINKYPILGVGIGRDRLLIANELGISDMTKAVGWYPHNIFLEILLHFGLFLGSVIIIFLMKLFFTAILNNKNKDAVDIICIFMGIGFFPLLVSGSYIATHEFFALLGFCLYQYRNCRTKITSGQ